MRANALCFIAACSLLLAACGGAETSGPVSISAAEGGTVKLGSKESKIVIPAAALPEDTEVVLKTADRSKLPPLDDMATALQIEPEGTVLKTMAELTIELDSAVTETQQVVVYQLIDAEWISTGSTVVVGKIVSSMIQTFAPVAVTLSKASSSPTTGGSIVGTAVWGNEDLAQDLPIELWQNDRKLTETRTDEQGKYSFADLTPGDYKVVLTHMAECPAEHPITVTGGAPTELDIVVCGG